MNKISLEPTLVWAFPWSVLGQFTKHTNLQKFLKSFLRLAASILGERPSTLRVVGLAGITQFLHDARGKASLGSCPSVELITQHLTKPFVHCLHQRPPRRGGHSLYLSVMAVPLSIPFPCGSLVTLTPSSSTPQVPASETIFPSAHISLESFSLACSLQIPEPHAMGLGQGKEGLPWRRGRTSQWAPAPIAALPKWLLTVPPGSETWGKFLSSQGCLIWKGNNGYVLKSKMELSFCFRA